MLPPTSFPSSSSVIPIEEKSPMVLSWPWMLCRKAIIHRRGRCSGEGEADVVRLLLHF